MLEVDAHGGPRHKENMGLGEADSRMLGHDPELDYAAHRLTGFAGNDRAVELATGPIVRLVAGSDTAAAVIVHMLREKIAPMWMTRIIFMVKDKYST